MWSRLPAQLDNLFLMAKNRKNNKKGGASQPQPRTLRNNIQTSPVGPDLRRRVKGRTRFVKVWNQTTPYCFPINLIEMPTRLRTEMAIYEKWFVHKLVFHFVPALAATEPGIVAMAPDYDPLDASSPLSFSEMMEMPMSKSFPLSSPGVVRMPNFKTPDNGFMRPAMYSAPTFDQRFSTYGLLWLVVSGSDAGIGDTLGYVDIEYDIELIMPNPYGEGKVEDISSNDLEYITAIGAKNNWVANTNAISDDRMQFKDKTPAAKNLEPNALYTAVLGSVHANMTLETSSGDTIGPGKRLYFRTANQYFDTVGQQLDESSSGTGWESAGMLSLDPSGRIPVRITCNDTNSLSFADGTVKKLMML
jgi:hypothetical protein